MKIDQSFIRDLATEAGNRAVVRATVSLCHDLGYRVVAEGVETQETLDLVAAAGCDEAQGFIFGQPLTAEAFATWFRAWGAEKRPGTSAPPQPSVGSAFTTAGAASNTLSLSSLSVTPEIPRTNA